MRARNATPHPEAYGSWARFVFSLILLVFSIPASAAPTNAAHAAAYRGLPPGFIEGVREYFYLAEKGMDGTLAAIGFMEARLPGPASAWPGVAGAYRAALEGLLGKHDSKLTVKITKVTEAIKAFVGIPEAYPSSLEIRFLRYAFYSQLPGIFGVGRYVKPDLEAIIAMLEARSDSYVPKPQQIDMADWLLAEAPLGQAERRRVTAARAALAALP